MDSVPWSLQDRLAERLHGLLVLALCVGIIMSWTPAANGAVDMHQVPIHISGSGDFPDLVVVAYPLDKPAAAKFVSAEKGVPFTPKQDEGTIVVLAVPRAVADKNEGQVDPAWLQPSAPDVIRVGVIEPQFAYHHVVVRYRVSKVGNRPSLELLNAEELAAAQKSPGADPSLHAPTTEAKSESMVYWVVAAIAMVVLAGGAGMLWRSRKWHQNAAGDNSRGGSDE